MLALILFFLKIATKPNLPWWLSFSGTSLNLVPSPSLDTHPLRGEEAGVSTHQLLPLRCKLLGEHWLRGTSDLPHVQVRLAPAVSPARSILDQSLWPEKCDWQSFPGVYGLKEHFLKFYSELLCDSGIPNIALPWLSWASAFLVFFLRIKLCLCHLKLESLDSYRWMAENPASLLAC